jgi:integrase
VEERKKIRESKGGGYGPKHGRFYIRVTVGPQDRQTEHAPWAVNLEETVARGRLVQTWVNRLRAAGQDEFIEKLVEQGALASSPERLAGVAHNVDVLTAGTFERIAKPTKAGALTFRDFAMQWVRGELAAKFPDHVDRKRTAYTDLCNLRRYAFPLVGDKAIADVTLDDYEQIMREIPARARNGKPRRNTRWHVAQVTYRVLGLAEYPAKVIKRNPVPASAKPKKRTEVALQFIYPDEDAALLGCIEVGDAGKPKVDLGHRVLYGFLDRAGWRREEALGGEVEEVDDAVEDDEQILDDVPALTWAKLDLVHCIVHLDREKTGRPRPVPIDPDIARALAAWRKLSPCRGDDDFVFVDMSGKLIDRREAAGMFRDDLLAASQARAELHDPETRFRRPVRLHDLRASMVSIALANGRPEEQIRRRTGHTSSALERYRRVAGTLQELTLGDWTPLDQAIPELRAVCAQNAARNAARKPKKPTGGTVDSSTIPRSRGDWIRTSDPLTPSQVR